MPYILEELEVYLLSEKLAAGIWQIVMVWPAFEKYPSAILAEIESTEEVRILFLRSWVTPGNQKLDTKIISARVDQRNIIRIIDGRVGTYTSKAKWIY